MNWKQEVERAASQMMINLNLVKTPGQQLEPIAVRVIQEIKPADYYVPQMVFTTKAALEGKGQTPAMFCEIWVNSVCIWRKSYIHPDPDKRTWLKEDYPEEAINKVWQEIVSEMNMFAIWNNYKFTIALHESKEYTPSVVPLNKEK